jgi:hypothetical protein
VLHVSHVTSTKPYLTSPQRRYACTSEATRRGTWPDTSGHPRWKASRNTDFSGARRRSSPSPPTPLVYFVTLTSRLLAAR